MDKIFVGKIVSTHGIKGEIRILSDFEYKSKVFVVGKKLVIDDKEYLIKSYRHHKNFEMVTLDDYNNINDVLFLLKKNVYIDKECLSLDDNEVLDDELITYKVVTVDGKEGKVNEVFFAGPTNKIIRVVMDAEEVLVPYNDLFVRIDKNNKIIYINLIDGMIL